MNASESVTTQLSETGDVATTVLLTVAATTDTPTEELPSLYDVVDPDALNGVFDSGPAGGNRATVEVTFAFADCRVSVDGDAVSVTRMTNGSNDGAVARPVAQQEVS